MHTYICDGWSNHNRDLITNSWLTATVICNFCLHNIYLLMYNHSLALSLIFEFYVSYYYYCLNYLSTFYYKISRSLFLKPGFNVNIKYIKNICPCDEINFIDRFIDKLFRWNHCFIWFGWKYWLSCNHLGLSCKEMHLQALPN